MKTQKPLPPAAAKAIEKGQFVRVDLDGVRTFAKDVDAASILVGVCEGRWVAYANRCPHQETALDPDFDDYPESREAGTPLAPMTDDGRYLVCLRHGAMFRLRDGTCIEGPCAGERLVAVDVEREEEGLLLGSED